MRLRRRSRLPGPLLAAALTLAGVVSTPAAAQAPAVSADTVAADTTSVASGRGALLRSLVLPGWGQTYVGAPGRGAVYFALEAASLWMVFKSNRALSAARETEIFLRETNQLPATQDFPLAAARRQQVEDWITLAVFWALFSGADAYVAAQLTDFTGHIGAETTGDGALRLQARLPVGRPR